jgi:hypothetical protein
MTTVGRIALLRKGFGTAADGTDRTAGPVAPIPVAEFQVASRVSALLAPRTARTVHQASC